MRRRPNPLQDANQRVRDLATKLHNVEIEIVLPLRSELAQARANETKLSERVAHLERLEAAYRLAWEAQIRLAAVQLASGKDKGLTTPPKELR
jgi:hypothetical protein